jgi:hypothetical protein
MRLAYQPNFRLFTAQKCVLAIYACQYSLSKREDSLLHRVLEGMNFGIFSGIAKYSKQRSS